MRILDAEHIEYDGEVYTKPTVEKALNLLFEKYPNGHKWKAEEFFAELFTKAKEINSQ
jgi:hypothetical protein